MAEFVRADAIARVVSVRTEEKKLLVGLDDFSNYYAEVYTDVSKFENLNLFWNETDRRVNVRMVKAFVIEIGYQWEDVDDN